MIAMVYHETELCDQERSWLNAVIGINNVDPALVSQATAHLTDINNPAPALHTCAGIAGSNQPILTPP